MSSANLNLLLPLPNTLPTATRCIQLSIPDDPQYFRLFMGALDTLTNWYSYDRDVPHTGTKVARLWQKAVKSMQFCPPPAAPGGGGGVIIPMFRQNPANPCQLQVSLGIDPDTGAQCWCTIWDNSLCTPNPAPGAGTTPPAAGKCNTYTLNIGANAVTLMPFAVNSGDTLLLSSVAGASSDNSLHWFCPDGSFFLLGACAGGGYTQSGDPLPTTLHNALLWRIGSNYYPVTSSTFTVPSGVVNQPIYLQVNNTNVATVAGSFHIAFTYCNNSAPPATTWCHHSNFSVTPDGYAPNVYHDTGVCGSPTQSEGVWSGQWQTQSFLQLNCTDSAERMNIRMDMGALVQVNRFKLNGTLPTGLGVWAVGVVVSDHADFSAGNVTLINGSGSTTGPYGFDTGVVSSVLVRYVQIAIAINTVGASPGHGTALTAEISGTGAAPPIGSNC